MTPIKVQTERASVPPPVGETVRLIEGGPLMSIAGAVGPLLLCVWVDEVGRVRQQAWSPTQLVRHRPSEMVWLRALGRLATRCKVVAGTG